MSLVFLTSNSRRDFARNNLSNTLVELHLSVHPIYGCSIEFYTWFRKVECFRFSNSERICQIMAGKQNGVAGFTEGSPCVKREIVIYRHHSQIAFMVELIYWNVLYVNVIWDECSAPQTDTEWFRYDLPSAFTFNINNK